MRAVLIILTLSFLGNTALAQCAKGSRGTGSWYETFYVRPDGKLATCETKASWGYQFCRLPQKTEPKCQWFKPDRCEKQGPNYRCKL